MAINLRPHHVLCSLGFEGKGYSDAFTANMAYVVNGQLRAMGGDDVEVRITTQADTICAPCPKRVGLGCEAQDKIDRLDSDHADRLGLSNGDLLTWGDCKARVRAHVQPDDLDTICAGCQWLPMGMCKRAVAELLEGRDA